MTCGLCFNSIESEDFLSNECCGEGHIFCPLCLIQYTTSQIRTRRHFHTPYPFPCPGSVKDGQCSSALTLGRIVSLLPSAESLILTEIEARAALGSDLLIQCPHSKCSMLIARPSNPSWDKSAAIYPCGVQCPHCKEVICTSCLSPDAHLGLTCQQYQALPANQRSTEDLALIRLAEIKLWKKCPLCQFFVERVDGCSHMVCRCGHGCGCFREHMLIVAFNSLSLCRCGCRFCYNCGANYYQAGPGTPHIGCKCGD